MTPPARRGRADRSTTATTSRSLRSGSKPPSRARAERGTRSTTGTSAVDRADDVFDVRRRPPVQVAVAVVTPRTRPGRSATVSRTFPRSVLPSSHELTERERKPPSLTRQLEFSSSRTRFAGRADRDPRRVEPVRARRAGRHSLEQRLERQEPGLDEVGVERGEGGLEPGDAERRLLERHLLLVPRVRRVVGRDARRSSRRGAPSISAARSSALRSGGFIFTFASSERTASSVRQRWCGVTSPVARTPAACARRARRPTPSPRGA